ncbi:MAG: PH domain-containing protein [Candidatus Cloacimonetes bacterium]|nr:PH domain-containing protein [Candidatus Cloacimonadota bacterium]
MNTIQLKPEPELKKLWQLITFIAYIPPFLTLLLLIVLSIEPILMGFIMLIMLITLLPILIYLPAFYKTLEYTIDGDAVKLKKGVFWRIRTTVPYSKITNIDITQGPVERMFQISHLRIQTAGSSGAQNTQAELIISGIRDSEALKDTIMSRIGVPTAATKIEPQNEQDTLKAILKELTAFRKAFDK